WPWPRRRGRRIPAAGGNGRANEGQGQKSRRPEGFRQWGRLASLLLGRRWENILPRRASPSGPIGENRTLRHFQTGSKDRLGGRHPPTGVVDWTKDPAWPARRGPGSARGSRAAFGGPPKTPCFFFV